MTNLVSENFTITRLSSISWKVGTEVVTEKKFGGFKCTCLNSRIIGSNPNCLHIIKVQDSMKNQFYK